MLLPLTNQVSLRQAITPDHLLGRMNASIRFIGWIAAPLGALMGGVLGESIGLHATLVIAALGGVLGFLWVWFSPLRTCCERILSKTWGPGILRPLSRGG